MSSLILYSVICPLTLALSLCLATLALRFCGIRAFSWSFSAGFILFIVGFTFFFPRHLSGGAAAQAELVWMGPWLLTIPCGFLMPRFGNNGMIDTALNIALAGAIQYGIVGWVVAAWKRQRTGVSNGFGPGRHCEDPLRKVLGSGRLAVYFRCVLWGVAFTLALLPFGDCTSWIFLPSIGTVGAVVLVNYRTSTRAQLAILGVASWGLAVVASVLWVALWEQCLFTLDGAGLSETLRRKDWVFWGENFGPLLATSVVVPLVLLYLGLISGGRST